MLTVLLPGMWDSPEAKTDTEPSPTPGDTARTFYFIIHDNQYSGYCE